MCWNAVWGLAPLIVAVVLTGFRSVDKVETTRKQALVALKGLEEWAKWMSGIQTAVAGGLLALIFKGENATTLPTLRALGSDRGLVIAVVVSMGAALFCTAWCFFRCLPRSFDLIHLKKRAPILMFTKNRCSVLHPE